MTEGRALLWLTGALVQRLLREGMVLRSLLSPPVLLATLVLGVLGLVTADQRLNGFAVDAQAPDAAALVQSLQDIGMNPVLVDDPVREIREGWLAAGTDGQTLWYRRRMPIHTQVEGVLRARTDASWTPMPRYVAATSPGVKLAGRTLVVLLTSLYAVYAVVFAAASVLRDRDEGTLEVEMALPVRSWVHPAARLLASWVVVGGFYTYGLLVIASIQSLSDAGPAFVHGLAAVWGAAALGLIAASSRTEQGFSSVLALGLSSLTGLAAIGGYLPALRPWMPIASVFTETSGAQPLATAVVLGVVGIALFSWRVRV